MTNNFPLSLTTLSQWLCWRYEKDPKSEKDRKVPYNPKTGKKASSTNPDHWASLDLAQEAYQRYSYNGLGFVFTREAGIVGVDVDHCIDPDTGALNEIVTEILAKVPPTYIEFSPSGTGLHIFLRGTMPEKGNKNEKTGVEMYAHSRFFTMTGKRYGDCPLKIAEDNGALAWIHATYIIVPRKAKKVKKKAGEPLSDEEILEYEGRYFRAKGENIFPLTNFIVQPIEMLISDDETQMTADLVTVKGEVFRLNFLTTEFSNLQRFKNLLNKRTIALSYTGSEGDLELLKSFIAELNWTRKTGVKAQGLYWMDDRWVYAAQDGAIEARSKPVDNVIQLERYSSSVCNTCRRFLFVLWAET